MALKGVQYNFILNFIIQLLFIILKSLCTLPIVKTEVKT